MDSKDPDRDLRQLFAAARQAEKARTPAFDRLWETAPGRRRPPATPLRLAAAAGAVATLALVFALLPRPSEPPPVMATVPYVTSFDWQGPTDFLLDTPGSELLSTVPDLGAVGSTPWLDLDEGFSTAKRTDLTGG